MFHETGFESVDAVKNKMEYVFKTDERKLYVSRLVEPKVQLYVGTKRDHIQADKLEFEVPNLKYQT